MVASIASGQRMFDDPRSCLLVHPQVPPVLRAVLGRLDLLKVLLHPGQFSEDRMLLGADAIESEEREEYGLDRVRQEDVELGFVDDFQPRRRF